MHSPYVTLRNAATKGLLRRGTGHASWTRSSLRLSRSFASLRVNDTEALNA